MGSRSSNVDPGGSNMDPRSNNLDLSTNHTDSGLGALSFVWPHSLVDRMPCVEQVLCGRLTETPEPPCACGAIGHPASELMSYDLGRGRSGSQKSPPVTSVSCVCPTAHVSLRM